VATINDITNAANYRGDKELGSYFNKVIDIDQKPLATLAAYTVMQNKALFDQRQKDADELIAELSKISKFDFSNAVDKDKNELLLANSELMKKAKERAQTGVYATPMEKVEAKIEFDQSIADLEAKIIKGNQRGISKQKQIADIEGNINLNAKTKSLLLNEVNKIFNDTGLDDPIPNLQKYAPTFPKINDPQYTAVQTNAKDANGVYHGEFKFFNPTATNRQSVLEITGIEDSLPENATKEQQLEFALRQAQGGSKQIWENIGEKFNNALQDPKFKKVNPDGSISNEVDVEFLKREIPMVGNLYDAIDDFNKYNLQGIEDARKGFYSTKAGKNVDILNIVKESDFYTIDKTKPISPSDLLTLQKFLAANPMSKDEKYTFTGEGNTRLNILTDAQSQREARANALTIAKLPYEQLKLTADGKTVSSTPFNPLASIIASVGALNKPVTLKNLSIAQVAAINPSWVSDGALTEEAKSAKISVGAVRKNEKGEADYGVFILGPDGKRIETLNESKLLSNGASWLATDAKETKGQDAYLFKPEVLQSALEDNRSVLANKKSGNDKTNSNTEKQIPASTIKSLVGKPGYEGYTEKELIEYYKANGYKVN